MLELLLAEKTDKKDVKGLRIKVIGGGCSGLRYELGWDLQGKSDMTHTYGNGLQVYIDDKSALYLMKSTLTYHNTLQSAGFKIENPAAKNTCGCGESFS